MNKRPVSVTIISVLIIFVGVLSLGSYSLAIVNGIEIESIIIAGTPEIINVILKYIGAISLIVGGILLFKGQSLGRVLVIGWCVLALILYADYLIPRIVYLIITVLMIFNKSANRYYNQSESKVNDPIKIQ
jgi:phosphoglycerol transferase MdoB-like AlkP superfamily enzyme